MEQHLETLTQAEEELTCWGPRKINILSDQDLHAYCPLAQQRGHEKARYALGTLELLPLEILHLFLRQLDLHSLMCVERLNRRSFDTVTAIPELKAIMQYSPDALRASLRVEAAPFITCQLLFNKLSCSACDSCGDFAGFLYVLTCTRLCYHCFSHLPKYLPLLQSDARHHFQLFSKDLKWLPQMKSVPGKYSKLERSRHRRSTMIDFEAAECYIAKLVESGTASSHMRTALASRKSKGPYFFMSSQTFNVEFSDYNPRRSMAIVAVPYINTRSRQVAQWGFHCRGCRMELGQPEPPHRQFLVSGFRRHLQQCGTVVNGKHVAPMPGKTY